MKIAKYALSVLLLFTVVLAGIWLPERFFGYSEKTELEQIQTEAIEPYSVEEQNSTTLLQKIELLNKYPLDTVQVTLSTGDYYDAATANEKCLEELATLKELGILPDIDFTKNISMAIMVSLYIDKNDPSLRATCWQITLEDESFFGTFFMDDETGKILQFVFLMPDNTVEIDRNKIMQWGDYLGLESKNIYYSNALTKSESQKYLISSETQETKAIAISILWWFTLKLTDGNETVSYKISILENGYCFGNTEDYISAHYYQVTGQ